MGSDLVIPGAAPLPAMSTPLPAAATEAVRDYVAASQAANTRRAYAADWRHFCAWCDEHQQPALPADPLTVAAYMAGLAQAGRHKVSTLKRRATAIGKMHKRAGLDNPAAHDGVRATLAGIARERGSAPTKKAAMTADLVAKAVRRISTDLLGLRDRALILLGFAGAFRRSELVALNVLDIARHPKGIVVTLRRSKTDQAGTGREKPIPHGRKLHVIEAIDAWLIAARIVEGPVFRGIHNGRVKPTALSDKQVARIVKMRCAAIGLDPRSFAGHSLRSGYITSAAEHGAALAKIADQAGHAKLDTTRSYVQVADAFKDHSGKGFL